MEQLVVLDEAFLGLVGAGAITLAPAYDLDIPPGAVSGGAHFVAWLWRESPHDANALVQSATAEIWSAAQATQMPADEIEYHLARLPAILELAQAHPDYPAAATQLLAAYAKTAPVDAHACARDLALAQLIVCRTTGTLGLSGLDEGVTFKLLEALFRGLIAAKPTLDSHQALMTAFLSSQCWRQPAPEQQTQPAAPETDPVRRTLQDRYRDIETPPDLIERCARLHKSLLSELDDQVVRATDATGNHFAHARDCTETGDIYEADVALAAAEDFHIQAALTNLASASAHLKSAAEVRILRGQLQEAFGNFMRAANHYALAVRPVPKTQHAKRWQFAEHQARALGLADHYGQNTDASAQADQVREQALTMLPAWWSEMHNARRPQPRTSNPKVVTPSAPLSNLLALIDGSGAGAAASDAPQHRHRIASR